MLMLSACTEKVADITKNTDQSQVGVMTSPAGNWEAKEQELSSQNKLDVQSDLSELNLIINGMNTHAIALREEIVNAANDSVKIKEILVRNDNVQQEGLQHLKGLSLKSAEVQRIRLLLIENLLIIQQMYKLSEQPDFDLSRPNNELKKLSLRSQDLQQSIGNQLDHLNSEFK